MCGQSLARRTCILISRLNCNYISITFWSTCLFETRNFIHFPTHLTAFKAIQYAHTVVE